MVKPTNSSQGKGIFLTKNIDDLLTSKVAMVVQVYEERPLLIENRKFDLRLYVLVTSIDPLRIYIYKDGIV